MNDDDLIDIPTCCQISGLCYEAMWRRRQRHGFIDTSFVTGPSGRARIAVRRLDFMAWLEKTGGYCDVSMRRRKVAA